jgi:hypothetical protein
MAACAATLFFLKKKDSKRFTIFFIRQENNKKHTRYNFTTWSNQGRVHPKNFKTERREKTMITKGKTCCFGITPNHFYS